MASVAEYFSQSYREAREKFLSAVALSQVPVTSFENPAGPGPESETLATDVAYFGPAEASRLLVLISATHGAEGFCGSGSQIALMREGRLDRLAADTADTAVLLIHAINPYGFAFWRRVNEDNVDLNRNSIDHANAPATSADFIALHPHLIPPDWDGAGRAAADAAIARFIDEHGVRAYQAAVSGGQYTHPDGLFYGGKGLVWSSRTFQDILQRWGAVRRDVAIIDFHTGLGPSGYGEPIYTGNDATEAARARAWYGPDLTQIHGGDSASAIVQGPMINAARWALPDARITTMALEFGTLPLATVLDALRAEHWLHEHGDAASPQGRAIKRAFRDSLYVDTDAWKEAIVERAREMTARGLAGLATMPQH